MAKRIDKSGMAKRSGTTINNQSASQISDESRKRKSKQKKTDDKVKVLSDKQVESKLKGKYGKKSK